jgi:hypothetical protein
MAMTVTVPEWAVDLGGREQSLVIAKRHVAAETSSDIERICGTIARDCFFAVPERTQAGNALGDGTVLTDYDVVHDYYSERQGSYLVKASQQLRMVTTEWFVFNDSAATLEGTGSVDGVDAGGKEFVVHSAVLVPTAPDGIRGEICITHIPFGDILAGTVAAPPPFPPGVYIDPAEMDNCRRLDRMVDAFTAGDATALAAELSDDHSLAVRVNDEQGNATVHTASSASAAATELVAMCGQAAEVSLLSRQISSWYIFAEYAVRRLDGKVRRLALLHSAQDGRLTGTYGYGLTQTP